MTYDMPESVPEQQSLRRRGPGRDQRRWIVCVCGTDRFVLRSLILAPGGELVERETTTDYLYSSLWDVISTLRLDRCIWWMVGDSMRYALDRADMVAALDGGRCSLPQSDDEHRQTRFTGRVVLSGSITEVDLVVARRRIKVIDWANLGIEDVAVRSDDYVAMLDYYTRLLQDYLSALRSIGAVCCRPTVAQIGWAKAVSGRMSGEILTCHNPDIQALVRQSVHPGRNECYRLGDIHRVCYLLDIKACYASICARQLLPCCVREWYPLGCDVETIRDGCGDQWVADVVITTDMPDYPVRHHGITLYPTGTYRTVLPHPELAHAIRLGRVQRVNSAVRYISDMCLSDYAQWSLGARDKLRGTCSPAVSQAAKAMFNAMLGFAGRKGRRWLPWDIDIQQRWWMGICAAPEGPDLSASARILDYERRWLRCDREPRNAMPIWFSTVCSYARVQLLRSMDSAGRDHVVYCDTDGMIVDYDGYTALADDGLIQPGMYGYLEERCVPGFVRIQAQKNYRVGSYWVAAGQVRTRESVFNERPVLSTPTGRTGRDGRVVPYVMECEDVGDQKSKWTNRIV